MIIKKSFLQHQRENAVPNIKKRIKEYEKSIRDINIEPKVLERFEQEDAIKGLTGQRWEIINNPR